MKKTSRIGALLAFGLVAVAGCDGAPPAPQQESNTPTTVSHQQDGLAFYDGIGRFLEARGVYLGALPVTAQTSCMDFASQPVDRKAQSAAYVYCDSRAALAASYEGRLAGASTPDTVRTIKILDLFMTAAPEVLDAMRGGRGVCAGKVMFDSADSADALSCNAAGVSCLQGYAATDDQLMLCARAVKHAVATSADPAAGTLGTSALENGKRIAAASIMSAAHLSE